LKKKNRAGIGGPIGSRHRREQEEHKTAQIKEWAKDVRKVMPLEYDQWRLREHGFTDRAGNRIAQDTSRMRERWIKENYDLFVKWQQERDR